MWTFYTLSLIIQKRYRWGDVNGKYVLSTKLQKILCRAHTTKWQRKRPNPAKFI